MTVLSEPRCVWDARAVVGEGATWSAREQALYWVDIYGRRLLRFRPATGTCDAWGFDEEICALAERTRGGLIVTLRNRFAFFDPETGALEPLFNPEPDRPNNRFNDGKCDPLGRFWVGTMDFDQRDPSGALYRLSADLRCDGMDAGYVVSNGPAWSPDAAVMYHNETARGQVFAFDFDLERGEPRNKRLFLQLQDGEGLPDGMAVDAEGCLWLAQVTGGKVVRYDRTGRALCTIAVPATTVTSCAFGGPSLRTLYITTGTLLVPSEESERQPFAGGLFAVDVEVEGLPSTPFAG